jgi:hypothetical protein
VHDSIDTLDLTLGGHWHPHRTYCGAASSRPGAARRTVWHALSNCRLQGKWPSRKAIGRGSGPCSLMFSLAIIPTYHDSKHLSTRSKQPVERRPVGPVIGSNDRHRRPFRAVTCTKATPDLVLIRSSPWSRRASPISGAHIKPTSPTSPPGAASCLPSRRSSLPTLPPLHRRRALRPWSAAPRRSRRHTRPGGCRTTARQNSSAPHCGTSSAQDQVVDRSSQRCPACPERLRSQ